MVKGKFRLRNSGEIKIGEACLLDSSGEAPIRIDIGARAKLVLGSRVYINEGTHIVCNISVNIGNGCLIASEVVILDDDGHPVDWRTRHDYWPKGPEDRLGAPVIIEDDVWVGTRAIILKGVTIGTGSVIAAGSVVTRSLPPHVLAAGIPARVVRSLDQQLDRP